MFTKHSTYAQKALNKIQYSSTFETDIIFFRNEQNSKKLSLRLSLLMLAQVPDRKES